MTATDPEFERLDEVRRTLIAELTNPKLDTAEGLHEALVLAAFSIMVATKK